MIISNIKNLYRYLKIMESFEDVFNFLKILDKDSEVGTFEFNSFGSSISEFDTSDMDIGGDRCAVIHPCGKG